MAVDKVRALKIESSSLGGTQNDPFPTETNPTQDYLSTKGVAFEGLDTFLLEKLGRAIVDFYPNTYWNITNLVNGNADYLELFNSSSFITANRIARHDFTYNANQTVNTEVLKIYDTNGSTILRTYTYTHTYSGHDYVSTALVIT